MTPATNLEYDDIRQSITEWALDYGITPAIIIGRLERGMTVASAITTPMKVGHRGQKLASRDMEAFINRSFKRWERERNAETDRRTGQTYTYNGQSLTIPEWSDLTGLKIVTIRARLYAGWDIEKALTAPADRTVSRPQNRRTRASLAREVGIDPCTVESRVRRGWTLDAALSVDPRARMGRPRKHRPGVPSNFAPSEGTGAGSTAQETPKITFSGMTHDGC